MGKKSKNKDMPNEMIILKGVRLFDPRYGKFRKPGNQNPALILYDLIKRFRLMESPEEKTLKNYIKKMANYCDKEALEMNSIITRRGDSGKKSVR